MTGATAPFFRVGGEAEKEGHGDRRDHGGPDRRKKRTWGALNGVWVQPDLRDQIVDFVRERAAQTELPASRLVAWIGIGASKFYDWKRRYGKVNEHNAWIPRDHWLEDWEKRAIIDFYQAHPDDGYRRVTYMMMDADIVAVSPSSVYRVLEPGRRVAPLGDKAEQEG